MLCLDIFGLIFLLVKLVIIPLVHQIQKRYFPHKNQASSDDEREQVGITHLSKQKVEEAPKNFEAKSLTQSIELTTILADTGNNKSENANPRRTIIETTYL